MPDALSWVNFGLGFLSYTPLKEWIQYHFLYLFPEQVARIQETPENQMDPLVLGLAKILDNQAAILNLGLQARRTLNQDRASRTEVEALHPKLSIAMELLLAGQDIY